MLHIADALFQLPYIQKRAKSDATQDFAFFHLDRWFECRSHAISLAFDPQDDSRDDETQRRNTIIAETKMAVTTYVHTDPNL
jgi:hypothetical protein